MQTSGKRLRLEKIQEEMHGKSLRIETLRKEFGSLVAVKDLTLEVKSGEFVSLLGPSGCGKSTTLNMIAGLLEPTSGKIFVGNQDITDISPIQRNVGLVFQNYAVFNNMTVYENLAFGLRVRKMSNDQIKTEVNKIAETLELSDILAMKAGKLRLDELQRTALGRSMITKPAFFLLDEPLSNLDAGLRSQMRVELKRIQRELKQTILYVTHDQVEAMSMADRIAVMSQGELQQYGSRDELYSNPSNRFVANFIGSLSMNFIDCTLIEKDNRTLLDATDFQIDVTKLADVIKKNVSNSELIMGIRPEDVEVNTQRKTEDSIQSEVYITEPIGPKTVVSLSIGNTKIKSMVPETFHTKIGEKLWTNFNMKKLHIFDKKSEKAIF
jgi:multiple sugar transport system ATP-binding protein